MIDITMCPKEVQTLKANADALALKANQSRERGEVVPFMAASACSCAYGVVSNWTNPPSRNGRKVAPPTLNDVKRANYGVCDMLRQIGD